MESLVAASKTTQVFGDLTLKNIELNLRHVLAGHPVESLFGKFKGLPAFLIGGGPSLGGHQINELKKVKGKALILAVGTALKPLLRSGLQPDIVVATDPQKESYKHFEGAISGQIPLVFLPTVCPDILRNYKGDKIVAFQEGYPEVEKIAATLARTKIKTGGSVVTTALDIIIRMGCDPITLTGCDLGFPGDKGHASGTIWDDTWGEVGANSRFNSLEGENRRYVRSAQGVWLQGVNGEKVLTHLNLRSYLTWIEGRLSHERSKFINCSAGVSISGTRYMKLAEVVERYCSGKPKNMERYIANLVHS